MLESNLLYKKAGAAVPFAGEVAAADFITGDALASAVGFTTGTSINSTTNWLKFNYNGKTLYVPKLPVRTNLSWSNIYTKGACFGTGGTADNVPTGQAKVAQSCQVAINGLTYIVRLLHGALTNQPAGSGSFTSANDPAMLAGCEWNALFYPIVTDPTIVTYTGPKIASPYALIDLGFAASYTWVSDWTQESMAFSGSWATLSMTRGSGTNITRASYQTYNSGTTNSTYAWRPCLELVA